MVQPAGAGTGVEQRLDFVAIPREQLLFFVPGEGPLGGVGVLQYGLSFPLEPGDFTSRQRISESEGDEISRALAFEVGQMPAEMKPGNKPIRGARFRRRFRAGRDHLVVRLQTTMPADKANTGAEARTAVNVGKGMPVSRAAGCRPLRQPGWLPLP